MGYTLERVPESEFKGEAPEDRLLLFFSTHDVTLTGWRLRPIAEPLIVCTHAQTPEAILAPKLIGPADIDRCTELGAAMAAGLASGIF